MKKLILSLFILSPLAFSAVTSATLWELRSAGTTTSGGGFDSTIASAGTDMSQFDNKNASGCTSCQSATVNISQADAVTTNTTTVTSATANFSAALIGNTIYLAGSGTTTGWYQCTAFTNSTTITVDRATGSTGGVTVTINIGGAIGGTATGGIVTLEIATNGIRPGNTAYVKTGGWGASTATNTIAVAGSNALPITYIGYTSSRSDGGKATFDVSSGTTTAFSVTVAFRRFKNLKVTRSGGTAKGFAVTAEYFYGENLEVDSTNSSGFEFGSAGYSPQCVNCWAHGVTGTGHFVTTANASGGAGLRCIGCVASGGSVSGFLFQNSSVQGQLATCFRCIAANLTGTADGFRITDVGPVTIINGISYGNAGDGLEVTSAMNALTVVNTIFAANTGVGIKSTTDFSGNSNLNLDYNAIYTAGTARTNVAAGAHDVTLSADPFTSSSDFSLNATGLTEAKGKAFPGSTGTAVLQFGGNGYLDPGVLQHQDPASSGGQKGYTWQ